jgi:hypothetical protein
MQIIDVATLLQDLVDYQLMEEFLKFANPKRVKRYLFQQHLDQLEIL